MKVWIGSPPPSVILLPKSSIRLILTTTIQIPSIHRLRNGDSNRNYRLKSGMHRLWHVRMNYHHVSYRDKRERERERECADVCGCVRYCSGLINFIYISLCLDELLFFILIRCNSIHGNETLPYSTRRNDLPTNVLKKNICDD